MSNKFLIKLLIQKLNREFDVVYLSNKFIKIEKVCVFS